MRFCLKFSYKTGVLLNDESEFDQNAAATGSTASSTSTPEPDIQIYGDAAESADSGANVATATLSGTAGVVVIDTALDVATFHADSATFSAAGDPLPKF